MKSKAEANRKRDFIVLFYDLDGFDKDTINCEANLDEVGQTHDAYMPC